MIFIKSSLHTLIALLLLLATSLYSKSASSYPFLSESIAMATPAEGPTVVDGPVAYSRHMGNDRNQHRYSMFFSINVTDPQGVTDIASVIVTGPTSITYTLTDPGIDGVWDLWTPNYDDPPSTGTYTFKVTDKSGNWIEVTDNITAVLNYPGNVSPAHYSVISDQNPVFSWSAVSGITGYNIIVADINGNHIWYKNGITNTTVTFNDDATAISSFVNGNVYNWVVNCYDADGNTGEQDYWVTFIYSENTVSPVLNNPNIKSAHYGDDYNNYEFRLQLSIQASDPQGFNDIATVKVTGTGGSVYNILENDGYGYYDNWFTGITIEPQTGAYIFRATDKSGNWVEKISTLTGIMDFPKNVQPVNNAVISTLSPVFLWDAVPGAKSYEVWVNNGTTGKQIWYWTDYTGSSTSVTFNENGLAVEGLNEGYIYKWSVKAVDETGNWGEHYGRQFIYSSDVSKPIIGNHDAVTYHGGNDEGNEDWGYDFWIDIADPQGSVDIASVILTAPDGSIYTLTDPENDGRYSALPRSSSQLQLGQCQFKVTDKSGNSATVYDTLYAWMDFPKNITPATNSVISTSTPVFAWDQVSGTAYYQVHVWPYNEPVIWGGINVYGNTSVTYNFNGTGQPLQTGKNYNWDVRSFDSKGNYGYHHAAEFIYSVNANSPVMVNSYARTVHYGDDNGNHSYYIHFSTKAGDPQGFNDIVSVIVTGPDQKTYTISGNSENSYFDGWFGGTTAIPVLGPYKFRITDKSGNWSEITANIAAVLDYPKNLKPRQSEIVSTPTPVFSWNQVTGATKYSIWVTRMDGYQIWRMDNLSDTSLVFNSDHTALEELKEGNSYLFNVDAFDNDNNYGEQNYRVFYYSLSTVNPVMTGNLLRSRHWADGSFNESYGVEAWINVSDPQGLSDIDSVWIDGPGSYHQKFFDDGTNGDGTPGDSKYTFSLGVSSPPVTGEYTIKSKDKSGNLVMIKDTLTAVLDYPKNLNIKHYSLVTQSDFPISWNSIPGAKRYEASVYNRNWSKTMWNSGRITGMITTKYNSDNTGFPLSEGEDYYLVIRADDGESGNGSEINNVKFVFRSDGRHKIYVDTTKLSGTEDGTLLNPYNTLSDAISRTVSTDTVIVSPGIYQGGIYDIGAITLIGKDPLTTIISGGYIGMRASNSSISGFHFKESNGESIEVHGDTNIVIVNNIISDNPQHGIVLGRNGPVSALIKNNTIVNNLWNGISVESDGSEVIITNNNVSHNGNGISVTTGSTIDNSYNIIFGNINDLINLEKGPGDIIQDPQYEDLQGKIYTLKPTSPALDSGDPDPDGDGKDWTEDYGDMDPDTTRMDIGAVFLDQRLLVPATPVKLTAVSCNDLVSLKWNKVSSPYFSKYRLYGGLNSNPETLIDSTSNGIADTSKVLSGLIHGQTYYFRVTAVSRSGITSDYSYQASEKIHTGLVPRIKSKWAGDVLICYNPGDSVTKYQWYKSGVAVTGASGQYISAGKQSGLYSVETIDIKGCKNMSKIFTIAGNNSITAYPNPASTTVSLKIQDNSEGTATVSVVSLAGKKVLEFRTENIQGEIITEIPVNELEKGIYYVNVVTKNKDNYSTKIVITR